jgi:hypothetical protein
MRPAIAAILLLAALLPAVARAQQLVPFVIPPTPNPSSLAAVPRPQPLAPDGQRIVAREGHFFRGERRIRVWGVNTCFGASFPAHGDAERLAERLAQAGINSVRLHHMDMAGFPGGIWDPKDPTKLSAEALDRLDYLIDQLARRGISVNANLHVSRTHSRHLRLPREGAMPDFDKMLGIFTPQLVAAQKKYARDLLTHVNRYRKVRYADDPAVAFVEITNEDSLFMWGAESTLRGLGPHYAAILQRLWIDWLKNRYGSTDALRKAWNRRAQPLGKNMIGDAAFTFRRPRDPNAPQWSLEQHTGAKASAGPLKGTPNAARVEIAAIDATDWHLQFKNVHLALRGGQYYTLLFRARADQPRSISLAVGMEHEPWGNLGLSRGLQLDKDWRTFRMGFTATAGDDNARVSFIVGGHTAAVELADVLLAAGGQVGLRAGESLEAAGPALFADSEPDARALDRIRFLADTEKRYFDGMRSFIRGDLGCKALVTGTIVFGPAGLYAQSDMDFVDSHAYWHHPHFPGRAWDMGNWLVENSAMTDRADGGTLSDLACSRLAGKPYTVSEYNHPAPMDPQAECVPMIAAFAASQDWDGVWLFAYCHRTDDWDRQAFSSFFDMDGNPGKFGFFGAAAVLFRDGGLRPVGEHRLCAVQVGDDPLTAFARLARRYGHSMRNVVTGETKATWAQMLAARVYVSTGAKPPACERPGEPIDWPVQDGRGRFIARGERAIAETGWWASGSGTPTFRAVMAAALDGKPLADSARILIAACGRCENTDMSFSADRRTVGRNWGRAPVRIEPVDHVLHLPGKAGQTLRLQPLGPDGEPKGDGQDLRLDKDGAVRLSASHATMWYLLTRAD